MDRLAGPPVDSRGGKVCHLEIPANDLCAWRAVSQSEWEELGGFDTVSVVIPAFNAERFIVRALDSIAAQTRPPTEVLIVDDGSTDATASAVEVWRDATTRPFQVVLVRQSNGGVPSARNLGIRRAAGQWIALLDADDVWDDVHLHRLLDAVHLEAGSVAAYGASRVIEGGRLLPVLFDDLRDSPSRRFGMPIPNDPFGRSRLDFRAFERLVMGNFIKPSSLLFSRQSALEVGLFDETLRSAEDREFLIRLLNRGNFIFLPEPITTCHWHGDNLGDDKNALRNAENGLRAIALLLENPALRLTQTDQAAAGRALRGTANDYLYLSARAGTSAYARGLRLLAATHGPWAALRAFRLRHLAASVLSSR